MSQLNHKLGGVISTIIICLILVVFTVTIVFFRQRIIDQITVWQYQPTAEVGGLVDRAGMNSNGKFYYLASQPKLDSSSDFNSECDRVENVTSILGCYSNSRIFVYDVTDPQLDGIREVTATHETLHAIYDRMSDDEKQQIDALIEVEYKKLSKDKDFADLLSYYARAEPGQRDNELHSIIGTEVAVLDPKLEDHYDQYFSNRQKVVELNAKYSSVFKSLKSQADALSAKLDTLSAYITTKSAEYNSDVQTINNDIAAFNIRAANGNFTSQAQFNSQRAALTQQVTDLQALRASIDDSISQYQTMLTEYNSLAAQSKKLYSIIDSTLAPAPTQLK